MNGYMKFLMLTKDDQLKTVAFYYQLFGNYWAIDGKFVKTFPDHKELVEIGRSKELEGMCLEHLY